MRGVHNLVCVVLLFCAWQCAASQQLRFNDPVPVTSDSFARGSWGSPIYSSNQDPENMYSCSWKEGGWLAVDPKAMLDVMEQSGQNQFFLTVNPNDTCTHQRFEDLASYAAAVNSTVKLYACLGKFLGGADVYEQLILWLRSQAAQSPNVVGFTVNDGHTMLHSPWRRKPIPPELTPSEFKTYFIDPAHKPLPENFPPISHIAYMPDEYAGIFLTASSVFGIRPAPDAQAPDPSYSFFADEGDVRGDRLYLNTSFSGIAEKPASVSFLLYSLLPSSPSTVDIACLSIAVNGITLNQTFSELLTGFIQTVVMDIPDVVEAMNGGTYEVSVQFFAKKTISPELTKVVSIWDMQLCTSRSCSTASKEPVFEAFRDERRGLDWDADEQYLTMTSDSLRVDDLVDATMVKVNQFTPIDADPMERFLESLCHQRSLRSKQCQTVFWGVYWEPQYTYNHKHQEAQFETARKLSDGVVVWELANELGDLHGGIFTPRKAIHPQSFDATLILPRYHAYRPNTSMWWTIPLAPSPSLAPPPSVAGNLTVQYADSGECTQAPCMSSVSIVAFGRNRGSNWRLLWSKPIGAAATRMGEVQLPPVDFVRLGLFTPGSVGPSLQVWAQFRLLDSRGEKVDLLGCKLEGGLNEQTTALWEWTTDFFLGK